MKKHIKTIALIAFTGILFTACSDDDDNTGASGINYTSQNVTVESPSPTEFSETAIDDADPSTYTAVIIASIPEITTADAVIDLNFTGSAVMGDDYEVSNTMIIIPAGSTSSSATITIMSTGNVESVDETIIVTASANDGNFTLTPYTETYTILASGDYINDVLNLEFDWEGEVVIEDEFSSQTYSFCALDFDFFIYDANMVDTGNTDAMTAACQEYVDFDSTWADGEYIIAAYLWANPYSDLALGAPVPITINYDQEFLPTSGTIIENGFTTDTAVNTEINIARITKNGYNYTVTPY